jgi:hypothetical protein
LLKLSLVLFPDLKPLNHLLVLSFSYFLLLSSHIIVSGVLILSPSHLLDHSLPFYVVSTLITSGDDCSSETGLLASSLFYPMVHSTPKIILIKSCKNLLYLSSNLCSMTVFNP